MFKRCINLILISPKVKNLINDVKVIPQIIEQMDRAQLHVRIALISAGTAYSLLGSNSYKIPIINKGVFAFTSLVKMHSSTVFKREIAFEGEDLCRFTEKSFDEIIIGSGPGGSIAAFESLKSGKRTLVIEMGPYLDSSVPQHGIEQLSKYFSYGGQGLIMGKHLIPFAEGSVVGGGSEINSGLYHRLPIFVFKEWSNILKLDSRVWEDAEKQIERYLNIQKQSESTLGCYKNSPIKKIAELNNWEFSLVPRWRKYTDIDFEHFGMNKAFIQNGINEGLKVLANHKALHISIDKKNVEIKVNGKTCSHKLYAKFVTISAGTIGTPQLLINSGLASLRDFSFNFHAMTRLVGIFNSQVNDLKDIDPHQTWSSDFGIKFGAAVNTKPMMTATLANLGINLNPDPEKTYIAYSSVAPKGVGSFRKIFSNAVPYYKFTAPSLNEIINNTEVLKRSLIKVGAINVLGKITKPSISTVHIFGSLPLGSNKILDKNGFLKNSMYRIRVCDASLLPSAPKVNPQGPISVLSMILSKGAHENFWN